MKRILCSIALVLCLALTGLAADKKLIALTFDDGPRPFVLLGTKTPPAPGLLDLLDKNNVKATFFLMGWRLTPKTWGEGHEPNIGVTCIDAATQALKRGHELENHTYSHMQLRQAERLHGDAWVLNDVEHGASVIKAITSTQPKYLRPPMWVMWPDLRQKLEARGYTVLAIGNEKPPVLRDINSEDYLCAGSHPVHCPQPSLADSVIRQIAAREKRGMYDHILTFHELPSTVLTLQTLIPELKARGYEFVRLDDYMKQVSAAPRVVRTAGK